MVGIVPLKAISSVCVWPMMMVVRVHACGSKSARQMKRMNGEKMMVLFDDGGIALYSYG